VVTPAQAAAIALWVAHTHAFAAADITPYLSVSSAEKRSGKSRLLDTLECLVPRPLRAAAISEAALFRSISVDPPPTLLFDEVDAIFGIRARPREDLRALLNAGFARGTKVHRCVGDSFQVAAFDVFSAKALAGIGRLPDTVEDRSIPIRLRRRAASEEVERFRRRRVGAIALPVRTSLANWAEQTTARLADAEPDVPAELDDRAADVWEPLIAIADSVAHGWGQRARAAALMLSASRRFEDPSIGVRLLGAIRDAFDGPNRERISTAALLEQLRGDEEAGWESLNPRRLANELKAYGIAPRPMRAGAEVLRGYHRSDFTDTFARYLSPGGHTAATAQQRGVLTEQWLDSIVATHLEATTATPERARPDALGDDCVADVAAEPALRKAEAA
jgi:hypothetical protein